jgi:hypothetical protein
LLIVNFDEQLTIFHSKRTREEEKEKKKEDNNLLSLFSLQQNT